MKKGNIPRCWANYCFKFPEEELLCSLVSIHLRKMCFETFLMLQNAAFQENDVAQEEEGDVCSLTSVGTNQLFN